MFTYHLHSNILEFASASQMSSRIACTTSLEVTKIIFFYQVFHTY
jgi:hypothetical protein